MNKTVRAIAFYLPQFHPIPENDAWWGEGFTEWTNVKKATPLFEGHQQPVIPGELGYYDLRNTEVRAQQAQLAKEYGIEGFCYWHYWFGNGKRILENVFNEVLESGQPDLPFCLAWANESWTGIWHGAADKMLLKQEYPGAADYREHFKLLIKAFNDPRYIRVDDKPLFVVYRPHNLPDCKEFAQVFREEALKHGLKGIYLLGNNSPDDWNPEKYDFDAVAPTSLHLLKSKLLDVKEKISRVSEKLFSKPLERILPEGPRTYAYDEYVEKTLNIPDVSYKRFPCVISNWDNTPRSQKGGWVLTGATPEKFQQLLKNSVQRLQKYPEQERFLFIKSWNEWAEGNYIEPDEKQGRKYLEACKNEFLK